MRVRQVTFAALAVAAGLALTACQNDDADQAKPAPTQTASTVPAASPTAVTPTTRTTPTGKSKPTSSPSPTVGRSGSKCGTDDLTITAVDRTIDGDKDRTVVVELKNHSGHDCEISGYASVDLNTTAGPLTADQSGEPVVPGVVKSGKSTFFGITYPNNTSGGSGVRITRLVISPPGDPKSVSLPWPGAASLPVSDKPGSPVKIGPMGSAGQGG
ncbi:DUF4232 domain-containing protein [Kitasatospora sp. NPDC048296]|uniref:DUF4232 domain-containing protein n=1 Tax=Kitasatospora sp. NPDC048296 TaxID=3364048 RepID=UPI00371B94F7